MDEPQHDTTIVPFVPGLAKRWFRHLLFSHALLLQGATPLVTLSSCLSVHGRTSPLDPLPPLSLSYAFLDVSCRSECSKKSLQIFSHPKFFFNKLWARDNVTKHSGFTATEGDKFRITWGQHVLFPSLSQPLGWKTLVNTCFRSLLFPFLSRRNLFPENLVQACFQQVQTTYVPKKDDVSFTTISFDEYAYSIPHPYPTLVHQGKGTKYPR